MPLAKCNETILNDKNNRDLPLFPNGIDESQYCVHDPNEREDRCPEDSGGPLQTTQTQSNPVKVVGIASFGIQCGNSLPRIYTRVAHYIEWIGAYVWPNGEIPTPQVSTPDDDNQGRNMHIWETK